jgi:hypothetical protein
LASGGRDVPLSFSSASPSASREKRPKDANLLLWIGQMLLALAFFVDAYIHTLGF